MIPSSRGLSADIEGWPSYIGGVGRVSRVRQT
jgi:hypothetical protein